MIRLRTPSRLHFGLFAPNATTGRRFGGLGMMVQQPGIDMAVSLSQEWQVTGPLAERGRRCVQRLTKLPAFQHCPPLQLKIEFATPEHQGLGTGTQFALAVARALAEFTPGAPRDATTLAKLTGRGLRSAIGTHGFAQGGFLVDAGKAEEADGPAPLLMRLLFPENWRVVLLRPLQAQGPADRCEREKFQALPETSHLTQRLCRLALLGVLPALVERCFDDFAEALHEYNRTAGEMYRSVQGGVYASRQTEQLVQMLRDWGYAGVGQSSWGPTLFVMTEDEGQAENLRERLRLIPEMAEYDVIVTQGDIQGHRIEKVSE